MNKATAASIDNTRTSGQSRKRSLVQNMLCRLIQWQQHN